MEYIIFGIIVIVVGGLAGYELIEGTQQTRWR